MPLVRKPFGEHLSEGGDARGRPGVLSARIKSPSDPDTPTTPIRRPRYALFEVQSLYLKAQAVVGKDDVYQSRIFPDQRTRLNVGNIRDDISECFQ